MWKSYHLKTLHIYLPPTEWNLNSLTLGEEPLMVWVLHLSSLLLPRLAPSFLFQWLQLISVPFILHITSPVHVCKSFHWLKTYYMPSPEPWKSYALPYWMAFFVLIPFTQLAPSHPSRLSSRVTPSSGCLLSNTPPTASLPHTGWDGNSSLSSHVAPSGCLFACTYHIIQITYTVFSFLIVIIKKEKEEGKLILITFSI